MKTIEIVMLMGAHCISPVEQTGVATVASKVQCAVVIERDSEAGTLRIVPAGASRQPEVAAVLQRLVSDEAAPGNAPTAVAPAPSADIQPPAPPAKAAPASAPANDVRAAEKKADEPKPAAPKAKMAETPIDKAASKCRGDAKPKWYTNAEGRRKYRCVRPG